MDIHYSTSELTVIVDLKADGFNRFEGTVYPISHWKKLDSNEQGWSYDSSTSSDMTEEVSEARVFFEFSYCWRGVWEGRIYFKDDEYWSEELKEMSDLWLVIEADLKQRIQEMNPDQTFDN